ncbi:MAG TPA: VanZ family protein [Gemmatimonadales bacterium]|nr:VanZ family protein [Gemmatimonadales bacterium]
MSVSRLAAAPRPARFALGLAVGAILYATLTPSVLTDELPPWWCVVCGERGLADFILNIILFVPLGASLRAAGVRPRSAILSGFLLSISIELTQALIPGRDTTIGDVISNTTGTLVGYVLAALVLAATRSRPRPLTPAAWALLAMGVVAGTGIALAPAYPPTIYYGQWTADLDGGLDWYRGHILRATIGGVSAPSERLADQNQVHALLAAGAPLAVTAVAGPAPARIAPVFSIYDDRRREILLLGARGADLILRYRTWGLERGLDRPFLVVPGALQGVRTGDTLRLAQWWEGGHPCLGLNGARWCRLGFTAGAGWAVLIYPERLGAWVRALLGMAWVGGILLPAGFFGRSGAPLIGAAVVAAAGLALIPGAVGLRGTPVLEWAGAALGIAVGAGLWRLFARPKAPYAAGDPPHTA